MMKSYGYNTVVGCFGKCFGNDEDDVTIMMMIMVVLATVVVVAMTTYDAWILNM